MSRQLTARRRAIGPSIPNPGGGGVITPPNPGTTRLWSDPGTHVPGSTDPMDVPQAGESFEIAADAEITLDVQTPALGNIMVYGTIIVSNDVDTSIDYKSLMFMPGSKLVFGDGVAGHYLRKFTLRPRGTITGSTPRMVTPRTGQQAIQLGYNNAGIDRSMMFEDGAEVMGGPPAMTHHWRLADHAQAGTNFIKIRGSAAGVKQGDTIVVGTTDFRGMSLSEEMTVAADVTGDTITFTTNLTKFHWGKLQWVTKTAPRVGHMSLTDEGWRPANDAPYVLDESAHILHLNRRITVDGSMDGDLGGRVMVHGNSGRMEFDGWRFTHMGVAGHQQWYGGVHHHMASYVMPNGPNSPSNGQYVGGSLTASLCSGHVIRNCAVDHSKNRGMVPHGSNGIRYLSNVGFDIMGSYFFGEEGAYQKCVIDDNHSIYNRPVTGADVLQLFDRDEDDNGKQARAAAFWHTNPDNTFTNNSAGDCVTGIWNAFSGQNFDMPDGQGCFGLSKNIPMAPGRLAVLDWENNEVYACGKKGILNDDQQVDEAGNVEGTGYPWNTTEVRGRIGESPFKKMKIWKFTRGAYANRVGVVLYPNAVLADGCGTGFNGATTGGFAANGLAVRESLNVTARPPNSPTYDMVANSYHGSLTFPGWVVVNYAQTTVGPSDETHNGGNLLAAHGMMGMWSEYFEAITFWAKNARGVELLNSSFGFRTPPMHLESDAGSPYTPRALSPDKHGDLSGAVLMSDDYLGAGSAGKFWIFPTTFATYGAANLQEALPIGTNNGYLTSSKMYGMYVGFNGLADATYDLDWRRLNPASPTQEVGRWFDPKNIVGYPFPNGVGFRHCCVMAGGVYKLVLPSLPTAAMTLRVQGSRIAGDPFVVAIPFPGSKTARVGISTHGGDLENNGYYPSTFGVAFGTGRRYTNQGSSAADIISGAANRFWQDSANNLVWVKYEGGIPNVAVALSPESEQYDLWNTYIAISAASDYP